MIRTESEEIVLHGCLFFLAVDAEKIHAEILTAPLSVISPQKGPHQLPTEAVS